jgi:hypothetical protein
VVVALTGGASVVWGVIAAAALVLLGGFFAIGWQIHREQDWNE